MELALFPLHPLEEVLRPLDEGRQGHEVIGPGRDVEVDGVVLSVVGCRRRRNECRWSFWNPDP